MPRRCRICILSLSPIHQDGRVLRQVEYASREYDVTVVGWGHLDKPRPNVVMRPVERWVFPFPQRALQAALMIGGRFVPSLWEHWYWRKPDHRRALALLLADPCDLIHVNEAIALPLGIKAAVQNRSRVLFDAHEYSPSQRASALWWRLLAMPFNTYLIRAYAHHADAMTTVAQGIAHKYEQEFGLAPTVVMNAPSYTELPFRAADPGCIRIVHHGAALRERHLEKMIKVMALVDERYTLDFLLFEGDAGYIDDLKRETRRLGLDRVFFRDAVPPQSIPATINAYDMGMFLLPPNSFNHVNALPNKFFEFIMAGLAIAIGPSPEMAGICREHGLGVIAERFEPDSLAQCLNQLSADEVSTMKRRSLEAAKVFNADAEMSKLLAIYGRLLNRGDVL